MRPGPIATLVALAAVSLASCGGPSGPSGDSRPNVLLITLDTTRADRLGCYGHGSAQTAALDRLAEEGARVEPAVSVSPMTLPSHASLLTGLYPPAHGVRENADFRLPEREVTLAERLRERGYRTAAVVASVVLASDLGLAQGFDTYDEVATEQSDRAAADGIVYRPMLERDARQVTDVAIDLLDPLDPGPFFLWVHYFDPHAPYDPPKPWAERLAGDPYDGEIAFMDAEIGRLLGRLERGGLAGDTLVVVTADHGESLGEHGEETHGIFLYEATTRVPLIVRFPGRIAPGTTVERLVSGVDIVPTILDLLDVEPVVAVAGTSFAPALRGLAQGDRAPVYAEAIYPERAYGWAPLHSLRDAGSKFIDAPEPELYDLGADPDERENLASVRGADVAAWAEELARTVASFDAPDEAATHAMDAAALKRLEALGYVASGAEVAGSPGGADPKRMVELHNRYLHAEALIEQARPAEAQQQLEQVLREDPGNPRALGLSGTVLFSLGETGEGLSRLERAAEMAPGVIEIQRNLANALHAAGRLDEAERAFRRVLALQPDSFEIHYALANLLFARGETSAAIVGYREAVRLNDGHPRVRVALGRTLAASGDPVSAEAELRRAVELDPGLAPAWNELGIVVEKQRRPREALAHYARALELQPNLAGAMFNHAKLEAMLGDTAASFVQTERLVSVHPDYAAGWLLKARLHEVRGETRSAREALERVLQLAGERDPALALRARRALDALGG